MPLMLWTHKDSEFDDVALETCQTIYSLYKEGLEVLPSHVIMTSCLDHNPDIILSRKINTLFDILRTSCIDGVNRVSFSAAEDLRVSITLSK